MRKRIRAAGAVTATVLLSAALAACGSSGSSSSGGGSSGSNSGGGSNNGVSLPLKPGENPAGQSLSGGKKGGTLTVYTSEDFIHFDPGQAYFSGDYAIIYPTERPLFAYKPNQEQQVSPDLATEMPSTSNGGITDGGKTITIHIHQGVRFSPPLNREVTSKDVAYALERASNPNVNNPYFSGYLGASAPAPIVGTTDPKYKGGPLPGISTPDKYTIVIKTTRPNPAFVIQVLSMPVSAPVPADVGPKYDANKPTTYGTKYLVETGPYMIKSDSSGNITGVGYQTGKSLTLVRNPNWSAATDWRPAYVDNINLNIGGQATVIGQQVLKGTHAIQLDTPAQSIVKLAYQQFPSQITFTTGAGQHYVGVDTQHGVFTNVNIRRALWAALNRQAIVKARGGPLVAEPMTHFLYPGVNGFDQSGGYAGPPVDYNKNTAGDPTVAAKYMKAAGYPSGKYTGSQTVQIVSSTNGNDPAIAQILNQAMTEIGLKPKVSLVDQSAMYSKYCQVPKAQIDACPAVGWIRDFADPLTVLFQTFYGPNIIAQGNSNFSQFNDPQVNAAMKSAETVADPTARAQAWANIDKMLVTDAAAIPEEWDNQANIESKDVAGVDDIWNIGTWDLAFTSLK